MNGKLIILTLCLAVAYVSCQVPLPCTTPPQWEARIFAYDEFQKDRIRARITYDSIYKRERIIEERTLGSDDEFFDVLYLHNQQIEYRLNLKTKECTKQQITRPWTDFGIPKTAKNIGESYVGSSAVPNANLLVTSWFDEVTDQKGNKFEYMGTWTYEACLPVSSVVFSKSANINQHTAFFDISPGIDNPNVFIPPRECLSKL